MFRCPELLFKPELYGKEMKGVHHVIYDSIQKCDIDIRSDLYQNVVLSGGSTMFPNFELRLERELQSLIPAGKRVRISAPEDRSYSVFYGGAILCSLPSFEEQWITPQEYAEHGAVVANRKCM